MPKFRAGDWVRFVDTRGRFALNFAYRVVEARGENLVLQQVRPDPTKSLHDVRGAFFPAAASECRLYMSREEAALQEIEGSR